MEEKIITSEAVSEGHPDKLCDAISDAILDECLSKDKNARVACEVMAGENIIIINGEITCAEEIDYEGIAKKVIKDIGYSKDNGFDVLNAEYKVLVKKQSPDIANAVNKEELGAGDQGIMFGYACDESDTYMPLPYVLANDILKLASEKRKNGEFKWARPDMKSQVSVKYGEVNEVVVILVSIQHDEDYDEAIFRKYIKEEIIEKVLSRYDVKSDNYELIINPSGRFVIGGPLGDVGLTGRKIIVDTYGGAARHGGGAFSGKDPSKVDRSAAYYLRYIAKNIVASGIARECELQVAYAIGLPKPISLNVNTFNTSSYQDEEILQMIKQLFDFRPGRIIKELDLLNIKYLPLSSYGHFGRDELDLPYERLDKVKEIKKYFLRCNDCK